MHLFGSHFGTYEVARGASGDPELHPFAGDPAPSPVGAAYLDLATHPERVLTPMVRRGWLEARSDLEARGRGRGRDDFVPLGWDEAALLVAGEIERVRSAYSNEAIFAGSYGWASAGRLHHAQSQLKRFLNLCGGFVSSAHTYSYGAATVLLPRVVGARARAEADAPSWDLIAAHADALVSFGGFRLSNAQVGAGGVGRHRAGEWLGRILDRGARVIVVSPVAADVPDIPGRERIEYIRLRPNTDTAVLLAIAHELVVTGRARTDFLARYAVGYEAFASYLLGEPDGTPKSAEWAAAISGMPADTIRMLAGLMAEGTVALNAAWSLQRARFGEQPFWALVALAAIAGQIGRPGGGYSFGLTATSSIGQPIRRVSGPSVPQGRNPVKTFIPVARITELLERPGETLSFDGRELPLPDIRLVWWAGGNPFHHHQDLNRLARAWRRPETVIVNEPVWTATARHADIVLPASLPFERNDIVAASRDNWLVASRMVSPPPGSVLSDRDIFARIAREFQLEDTFTGGLDEMGWIERIYDGYRTNHPELPSFEAFWEAGYAALDADADAPAPFVPLADFIADPDGAPLDTPSGRIEIASATIAGFSYPDAPGHPAWLEPEEGAGGGHPLHLLSPQPAQRLHSQLEGASVAQGAKRNGCEVADLNPADAASRGIEDGDIVEIFNGRGRCLAAARLNPEIAAGIVVLPTGGWFDPVALPDGSIVDRGGNPNTLTSDLPTSTLSQASAPNTCRVEVRAASAELRRLL
ncbi:biotin/methionine sulfoxide reductase [Amorphus suaedae]